MATLAQDKPRSFAVSEALDQNEIPAVATDIIYEGAAVGDSSGNARPLVGGDAFIGFCRERCDNSAGAAGAKKVKLIERGKIQLSVTGVSSSDNIGATVYATDDDTFTLTASGASSIGKVARWITGTTCIVFFESASKRSI